MSNDMGSLGWAFHPSGLHVHVDRVQSTHFLLQAYHSLHMFNQMALKGGSADFVHDDW